MNKTSFALLLLSAVLLSAPSAAAQTVEGLERILAFLVVSYGEAAWVILNAAGAAEGSPENSVESSESGVYRFAKGNGWLPKKAAPNTPVTLGGRILPYMEAGPGTVPL
jgi:hypothetical protein